MASPTVAVIILNYNGWEDTLRCVSLCLRQLYPDFFVIVVDNASSDGSLEKMKEAWASGDSVKYLAEYDKNEAEAGGTEEKENELDKYGDGEKLVLIRNDKNLGYSAGNNVGIRYALKKKADAALIVNPDVEAEDNGIIAGLAKALIDADDYFVAGPRVLDRQGCDQNPMREPSLFEEVFGPLWKGVMAGLGKGRRGCPDPVLQGGGPRVVEKVSGCCAMIKSDFFLKHGLLDETIFMYSEEAVLAHEVGKAGRRMVYVPSVAVRHVHLPGGDGIKQYRQFMQSRIYFLSRYRRYGSLKILMVKGSYGLVLLSKVFRSWRRRTYA
ncbi:MAG: glycosyltransferase family 2 protein [Candidatus Sulfobium sp.]|jgi:GT2 family glycosyltransferase